MVPATLVTVFSYRYIVWPGSAACTSGDAGRWSFSSGAARSLMVGVANGPAKILVGTADRTHAGSRIVRQVICAVQKEMIVVPVMSLT
jgi:hypothetical protein